MKLLTVSAYISSNALPCYQRNKTGYGYMVHDISKALVENGNHVDALTFNYRHGGMGIDGVRYLGYSWLNIIRCLFQCIPFFEFAVLVRKYPMSSSSKVRLLYCWLLTGYYRSVIKHGQYDAIHFHGIGYATDLWIKLCKLTNQPFVITLHALTSFSESVKLETAGKQYERNFFKRVVEEGIPITVVGSGMKQLIEQTCGVNGCKNIKVVPNSISFPKESDESVLDLRKSYNIPVDGKIILYVGNICERKNQRQIIKAFDYLPEAVANNTFVLFLGGNKVIDYNINTFINNSQHRSHFVYCGVVEKDMLASYYRQADAVALLSVSEAFGLSLAEGMHFGLPSLAFYDIDAIKDIYSPDTMVCVREHSDNGVAEGIVELLSKEWNRDAIKKLSKKFDSDVMANEYLQVYSAL